MIVELSFVCVGSLFEVFLPLSLKEREGSHLEHAWVLGLQVSQACAALVEEMVVQLTSQSNIVMLR